MSTTQLQTTIPASSRTTGLTSRLLLTAVGGNVADTVSLDVAPDREPGIDEVVVAIEAARSTAPICCSRPAGLRCIRRFPPQWAQKERGASCRPDRTSIRHSSGDA